jgi:hypothetical protein
LASPCGRIEERNGEYDFEQLKAAIWYFRDLDAFLIGHPDAHSRAIQIRYSTKWFDNYFSHITDGDVRRKIRGVFQLVHWLTVLMENNPVGECRPPPMPVID